MPSGPSPLLTAAARKFLAPNGLEQRGRSRVWIDDHCWWLGIVEFQPSQYGKGAGLNVAIMWMWSELDHLSYDEPERIHEHAEYRDDAQFTPVAEELAQAALQQIFRYRVELRTVADAHRHVRDRYKRLRAGVWQEYAQAILAGLSGDAPLAAQFFQHVLDAGDEPEWLIHLQGRARRLLALVDDRPRFEAAVSNLVAATRALLGLPACEVNWRAPASE